MEDSSMWMDIGDDFNNMIDSFEISIESSPQMDFYQVSAPTPVSFGNNTNINTSPNFTPITNNSPPSFYVPPGYQPNNQNQITAKSDFDEEYLVTLDSDTFQDYVQQIRKRRSLTRNEEQVVKRLVKKIKNRESARKSRQAKKEISQELDEQVIKLTEQAQSLKLELSALYATNQQIKNEISFSEKLIASNPFLSKLYAKTLRGDPIQNNMKMNSDPDLSRCNPTSFNLSSSGVAVHS